MVAQFLNIFVQCETWRIGRDLKQHAARLAEVNRVKISSIDHRSYVVTEIDETFAPHELLGGIAGAKCDVMDRASCYATGRTVGRAQQIDNPSGFCFARCRQSKTTIQLFHQPVTKRFGQ